MSDATVLNLILFLPVIGMALLAACRSDSAVRQLTFWVMVVQFVLTLRLYMEFQADVPGLQFETRLPWIADWGVHYHIGLDGFNVLLVLLTAFLGPLVVAGAFSRHPEGRQALLRDGVPDPVHDAGHLPRAGPVPVLRVLGGDADPDVPDHRHLGRRAAHLRDAEVRAVHGVRLDPDAGRGHLSRLFAAAGHRRVVVLVRRPVPAPAAARCPGLAAGGIRAVIRDQGADRAAAYVAARCARRGAHRGFGDPGRRAAENGHLRLHQARLPAVPAGGQRRSRLGDAGGGRSASSTAPAWRWCRPTSRRSLPTRRSATSAT